MSIKKREIRNKKQISANKRKNANNGKFDNKTKKSNNGKFNSATKKKPNNEKFDRTENFPLSGY